MKRHWYVGGEKPSREGKGMIRYDSDGQHLVLVRG